MRCGFGSQNITPLQVAELAGYGPNLKREWGMVHDDLRVRALAIESGTRTCLYVQLDVTELGEEIVHLATQEVRNVLSEEQVPWLVFAPIHTHNAPATLVSNMWGQFSKTYTEQVTTAIGVAAAEAVSDLSDCAVGYGEDRITEIGFNRAHAGKPWDDRLQVVHFKRNDKKSIVLFSAAVHPVCIDQRGPLGNAISADWVGYAIEQVEQSTGCHALFMMGTSGDVDPVVAWRNFGFEGARLVGALVSERVLNATLAMKPILGEICICTSSVRLPLNFPVDWNEVHAFIEREIQKHISTGNEEKWHAFYSAWIRNLQNWSKPELTAEAHVLCMGSDFALISLPGEIFSSVGNVIREIAPFQNVVFNTIVGTSIGYIPDVEDFENHGYASYLSPCIMGYPYYRKDVGQALISSVKALW